jgi:hypothetical protein
MVDFKSTEDLSPAAHRALVNHGSDEDLKKLSDLQNTCVKGNSLCSKGSKLPPTSPLESDLHPGMLREVENHGSEKERHILHEIEKKVIT